MTPLLKLAATLPPLALLSACAATMPNSANNSVTNTNANSTTEIPIAAYDRMAPNRYSCTDNSQITAKQSIDKKQVMINVTLPSINWKQQPITLNGGVNGATASYMNDTSPDIIYAWHMKQGAGLLALKWRNGEDYHVTCEQL